MLDGVNRGRLMYVMHESSPGLWCVAPFSDGRGGVYVRPFQVEVVGGKFFFEHVAQGSIGLDLEYSREVLAWDFAARAWVKRSGCRRFHGPDMGLRVREAVDALEAEGSVLVVWDAFPWMVGLMWDADSSLWATVGKTEMVSTERAWPELRDEFFGWFA